MALTYIPTACLLIGLFLLSLLTKTKLSYITRDPHAVVYDLLQNQDTMQGSQTWTSFNPSNFPVYIGAVSNLGILAWCAAAVTCFFSYLLLSRRSREKPFRSFFFFSGGISTILLFDDLFLLHEEVIPNYFGFFSLSSLVDRASLKGPFSAYKDTVTYIENSFKFFGIVSWSSYYIRTCLEKISAVTHRYPSF